MADKKRKNENDNYSNKKKNFKIYKQPEFRQEIKCSDHIIELQQIVNTTTTSTNIEVANSFTAGAGATQRIGNKIKILTLRLTGNFQINTFYTSNVLSIPLIRVIVVLQRQKTSSLPNFNQIFIWQDSNNDTEEDTLAPLNQNYAKNYLVLSDDILKPTVPVIMPATSPTTPSTWDILHYNKFIDLRKKNIKTIYNAETDADDSIQTNRILIIFRTRYWATYSSGAPVYFTGAIRNRYIEC